MTKVLTRILVNRRVIAENRRTGADEPVISVKQGKRTEYCHELAILGPSKVVYDPEHPKSGATVWIETRARTIAVLRGAKKGEAA